MDACFCDDVEESQNNKREREREKKRQTKKRKKSRWKRSPQKPHEQTTGERVSSQFLRSFCTFFLLSTFDVMLFGKNRRLSVCVGRKQLNTHNNNNNNNNNTRARGIYIYTFSRDGDQRKREEDTQRRRRR